MTDRKEDIIAAATRLFAARGFDGVSVRDICARAHVSVAMVNYHFRNKEGLYGECLARVFTATRGEKLTALTAGVRDAASWRAAMRTWIVGFATAMHETKDGESLAAGLFRHEVTHPSALRDIILTQYAKPVRDCLVALLKMALDDERDVMRWTVSLWAQLSAYAVVDPSWQTMFRPARLTPMAWGEAFADFVCARVFKELKYKKRFNVEGTENGR